MGKILFMYEEHLQMYQTQLACSAQNPKMLPKPKPTLGNKKNQQERNAANVRKIMAML